MQEQGMDHVFQLDGGILRYFEEVGGAHYEGNCFVFDRRVALTPELKETGDAECFNCRAVVSPMQQRLPSYKLGVSCYACLREEASSAASLSAPAASSSV
jgi:UPF0176 protein